MLVLRPFRPDDLDVVAAMQSDPEVLRYLPWPERTREQSADWLAERVAADRLEKDGDVVAWAVEEGGAFVGLGVLFLHSVAHRQVEVGYALARPAQGRGLGTELARLLVQRAFDDLDAHRVSARVDPGNAASLRLLARLGFREEGRHREDMLVRGRWTDTVVLAVLREEWAG